MTDTRRVLIVEDDPNIAQLVRMHVADLGHEPVLADSGEAGLEAFLAGGIDLVVLDVMLPGTLDGLAVCREIRAAGGWVPILMLTAKSSELDRVIGLESGADDYLAKPFGVAELQARIKALFRRVDALSAPAQAEAEPRIERNGLVIDTAKRSVHIDGVAVDLTAREFDLLVHFARRPGQVFSRAQLLDQVWGYNYEGYEHTVNTHINRLRAKIEADPANPRFIETVWGVGYRFAE